MTIRSTVYLDPGVDDAIIAELERMPFRRRAGRLVQLLRTGAETSLRQRDGTLRGGLVRCRVAHVAAKTRVRVGIRLAGPADAAVMQLLAESPNRRTERLRQLAQCGLEREAFWAQEGVHSRTSAEDDDTHLPLHRPGRLDPMAVLANLAGNTLPGRGGVRAREGAGRTNTLRAGERRWYPMPTGTPYRPAGPESDE